MQSITLDLIPQEVKPILRVSQYDDNWDVKIFITENGEALAVSPTDTATMIIRKPDGNIVTLEAEAAYADAFKVTLTEQACACYGDSFGELVIETTMGGVTRRKGTCNFILNVEISPEFGGIDSTTAIANLRSQIGEMASDEVQEIAPAIIAEIAPTIIGDEYLTKTQIESGYYNKEYVNTNYYDKSQTAKMGNRIYPKTLTAGNTTLSFEITPLMPELANYVQFFINEPNINEPTYSVTQGTEGKETITLTFDSAFDHDVVITALQFGIASIHQ